MEFKRIAYHKVIDVLEENKISILVGLRRVGKTTILKQIQAINPNSELIRCDSIKISAMSDQEFYIYLTNLIKNGKTLLLLDEVQVRSSWDLIVKNLFDEFVDNNLAKVVVTGSSSLTFKNKDTGVTRTQKVLVSTLDFDEYSQMTGITKSIESFEKYLGNGAFPEFINKNISFEEMLSRTLEPILNDDIPSMFNLKSSGPIIRLLFEISSLTNGEFNKTKSSSNTGIAVTQIESYLDILEKTQIIKTVKQVNENATFKRYTPFKIYINPHFHLWLLNKTFNSLENKIKGQIIEAYWLFASTQINGYYKKFYYYKNSDNQEIDFVSINPMGNPPFKTLHEFKYVTSAYSENYLTLIKTPSINKVVWCKETLETREGIKFENIINYKNDYSN